MSIKLSSLAIVASIAAFAFQTVSARSDTTRAEVKAETRSAQKAGRLTPAGEGSPEPAPTARSNKTRVDRKGETLQARKAGELRKAGLEPEWKAAREAARTPSTSTRAERKAITSAAARAGQLTPAGEGVNPSKQ